MKRDANFIVMKRVLLCDFNCDSSQYLSAVYNVLDDDSGQKIASKNDFEKE